MDQPRFAGSYRLSIRLLGWLVLFLVARPSSQVAASLGAALKITPGNLQRFQDAATHELPGIKWHVKSKGSWINTGLDLWKVSMTLADELDADYRRQVLEGYADTSFSAPRPRIAGSHSNAGSWATLRDIYQYLLELVEFIHTNRYQSQRLQDEDREIMLQELDLFGKLLDEALARLTGLPELTLRERWLRVLRLRTIQYEAKEAHYQSSSASPDRRVRRAMRRVRVIEAPVSA